MAGLLFPPAQSNLDGVQVSGTPSAGQILTATSAVAADWASPTVIDGVTVSGTPSSGNPLTATSSSAATWQPVSGQFLSVGVYIPPSQVSFTTASATLAALSIAATTVASGSNGGEISTIATWATPSAGVLSVASTAGWPTSGTVTVAASGATTAIVTFTGTSATTLTGCAYVSGSPTGTVATGGAVALSGISVNTGSFTAPPSGNVLVTTSVILQSSLASDGIGFALAAHGTVTPVLGSVVAFKAPVTTQPFPYDMKFYVSGLSAGTYNFDLLSCMASAGTLTVFSNNQSGTTPNIGNTGVGCPIVMTVQAV